MSPAFGASTPEALVSYANFPSTEYLTVDFTDFVCFNVYLHDETAFRRYVARLHNLAVDRPLVLTEFGVNSIREGSEVPAPGAVMAGPHRLRDRRRRHLRLCLDRRVVYQAAI